MREIQSNEIQDYHEIYVDNLELSNDYKQILLKLKSVFKRRLLVKEVLDISPDVLAKFSRFSIQQLKQLKSLQCLLNKLEPKAIKQESINHMLLSIEEPFIRKELLQIKESPTNDFIKQSDAMGKTATSESSLCIVNKDSKLDIKKVNVVIKAISSKYFFNYESINNQISLIINSRHSFYSGFYCLLNDEGKSAVTTLLYSLALCTNSTILEKVRNQDESMFIRWADFIESNLDKINN